MSTDAENRYGPVPAPFQGSSRVARLVRWIRLQRVGAPNRPSSDAVEPAARRLSQSPPSQKPEPQGGSATGLPCAGEAAPRPQASTSKTAAAALRRAGEAAKLWFRTERVFKQNGAWYIATRENIDVGPYADARTARNEAKQLIELLAQRSALEGQDQALTIRQFMNRPTTHGHR